MTKWTILFYANGNNELEPYIWKAFLILRELKISKNINIVVQISRAKDEITKIIRPNFDYPDFEEKWIGCRRYIINKDGCKMIADLNTVNMASPVTLKDFIIYGQQNYPSDKYMLILGGHVYQFIGMSPDFSLDKPYLMGFPQVSESIQQAGLTTNKIIDILLLDTCYTSTLETLCEFGKYETPAVDTILTYIGEGPMWGFPFNILIEILEEEIELNIHENEKIISEIIKVMPKYDFNMPLIGVNISNKHFLLAKMEFSILAKTFLENKYKYPYIKTPYELLSASQSYFPWRKNLIVIEKTIKKIIIKYSENLFNNEKLIPVNVLYEKIPDEERKQLYEQLYFAYDNAWLSIICDKNSEKTNYNLPAMEPMIMTENILQAFISNSNTGLNYYEQISIKDKLIKFNSWEI